MSYNCTKTKTHSNENVFYLTECILSLFRPACPCLSKSPSGKWNAVCGCCGWVTTGNANHSGLTIHYTATIWKLHIPEFSGPWAVMTHEDALQCLFPWWDANALISVCLDGVTDAVVKQRLRVREGGQGENAGGGCGGGGGGVHGRIREWMQWKSVHNCLISFLPPDYLWRAETGTGLLSSPRSGPLSLGQHPPNLTFKLTLAVWQRACFQTAVILTWSELRHSTDNTPKEYWTKEW